MASESKGVSLDTEVWEAVQRWADKEGRSLSNAIERLIRIQLGMTKEKV